MGILSSASTQQVAVLPSQQVSIAQEGFALFSDTFDGSTIDTTYRWNAAVVSGGGTVTQTGSNLVVATSTTASNAGALSSIQNFVRVGFGWLKAGFAVALEANIQMNSHRFWGFGTPNGSYTALTPLQDAIGFEVDISGQLRASIYSGGTRVFSQALPTPTDGFPHAYTMQVRDDFAFWFKDNLEIPVAMSVWTAPSASNLPVRVHMVNHTTGPAAAPTLSFGGLGLADSSQSYPVVFTGQTIDRARSPGKFIALNAAGVSVASETTIWTPAAGRKFRLMGYQLTSGTVGGNVTLKDNTAGTTILVIPFGATGSPNLTCTSPPMGNGILSAAINNVLTATGVATQTLSGFLFGTEE